MIFITLFSGFIVQVPKTVVSLKKQNKKQWRPLKQHCCVPKRNSQP